MKSHHIVTSILNDNNSLSTCLLICNMILASYIIVSRSSYVLHVRTAYTASAIRRGIVIEQYSETWVVATPIVPPKIGVSPI